MTGTGRMFRIRLESEARKGYPGSGRLLCLFPLSLSALPAQANLLALVRVPGRENAGMCRNPNFIIPGRFNFSGLRERRRVKVEEGRNTGGEVTSVVAYKVPRCTGRKRREIRITRQPCHPGCSR